MVDARFAVPFLLFVLNGGILFEQMACSLQSVMENAAYLGKWMLGNHSRGTHLQKEAAVTAFGTVENEFDAFQVIWTWLGGAKRAQR